MGLCVMGLQMGHGLVRLPLANGVEPGDSSRTASKPRLLDLFCGAGGAAVGYERAGFEVIGVDINPQPRYPFEFCHVDAFKFLEFLFESGFENWWDFDVIHASPPCQKWTLAQNARKFADKHEDLIAPLRPLLEDTHLPYVIENVPKSPLRADLILCGTQFGLEYEGFELRRHRVFELNWDFGALLPPCSHVLPAAPVFGHSASRDFRRLYGRDFNAEAKREIMGVQWMTREESREAIPPAFTEFIGTQLLAHLKATVAA